MMPIVIYTTVLLTFTFNIFILCFIGQLLTDQVLIKYLIKVTRESLICYRLQSIKVYITSSTLDWYRIPHKTAHGLILIIAVSSIPIKITAGKFMDLSLNSFGAVSV